MTSPQQHHLDTLAELVSVCDPMLLDATPWTQKIRERFGPDDTELALATALGSLARAAHQVLNDIERQQQHNGDVA